jgi:hypothetical protein
LSLDPPPLRNNRSSGKPKKEAVKFRATVDKNTALTLYQREGGFYIIVKKDLVDYELGVNASEAPIINQFLKTPDPYESLMADPKIIEKEIEPIALAIQTVFGENKEISLTAVKLAIGSGENDNVTIDESDLYLHDVEPTLQGLLQFVNNNKDNVIGIVDRIFDHEKGNIILLDAKIRDPAPGISTIEIKLISSLQQRSIFMQKYMKYAGVQRYIDIKAENLTEELLLFLKEIEVDWETIFLRRDLALEEWIETECERNSINLKGYISAKYESLGFFDVNNIVRVVVKNQLNFKIADKMADILNHVKGQRSESVGSSPDADPLKKAEIIAAARLGCAYYGLKKEIELEKDISPVEVARFEEELVKI